MAALFESNGEEEKFLGFLKKHESGRNIPKSESDISGSTVILKTFRILAYLTPKPKK